MEVGRLCLKIAGREAGKTCVIVDVLDDRYVLIDGEVRRKKCNLAHLEPLAERIAIEPNADHAAIVEEFKRLQLIPHGTKPKQSAIKPMSKRAMPKAETPADVKKPKAGKKPATKAAKPKTEPKAKAAAVVKTEVAKPKVAKPKKTAKKGAE